MNDDMKAAVEWLDWLAKSRSAWGAAHCRTLLDHIDSEPERIARAREEQREADAKYCPNCLGVGFVERPVPCLYCDDSTYDHQCPTGTQRQQCGCGAERIRSTPLDATPLADELERSWQETAKMVERAEKAEARVAELELKLGERIARHDRDVRAVAERDEALRALRALVTEVSWKLTRGENEPGAFERAWQTACAVLAKHKEGP